MLDVAKLSSALGERYRVMRAIGHGGMAAVYRAVDLRYDRQVAIKVLESDLAAALGARRFLAEVRVTARLQHPNILPLLDSGEIDGVPYFVSPLAEEGTLSDLLRREKVLDFDRARRIARDVADALDHAHKNGVVHRDIKPSNILLSGPRAVVADFGVALTVGTLGDSRLTGTGYMVGTPAYMSPEQAAGAETIGPASDIYALACVVFEMLAGEPPFSGSLPQAVLARQLTERPRRLSDIVPDIRPEVDAAVARALAKDPDDRHVSAGEFAAALGAATPPPRRTVLTRRPKSAWPIALAAAVAFGGWGLWAFLDRSPLESGRQVLARPLHGAASTPIPQEDALWYALEGVLGRVPDVSLEESARVQDRLTRVGGAPDRLSTMLDVARDLGAGELLLPEFRDLGDSILVRLSLFDVSRGREVEGRTSAVSVAVSQDLDGAESRLATLAEELFRLPRGSIPIAGTTVREAALAYAAGRSILERTWDLDAAETRLREALGHDPAFAAAHLLLAEILSWAEAPAAEWLPSARIALRGASELTVPFGAELARGLVALGAGNYPAACDEYAAILAADSTSFRGWFGLGECHGRDPLVVPDTESPSGWSFRGSYHTAIEAYRRALDLVPSSFSSRGSAYSRITNLLFVQPNRFRSGHAPPPDTTRLFVASIGLEADTLAFVPAPMEDVMTGRAPEPDPGNVNRAVERNRQVLMELATSWTDASPGSGDAHEARSFAFEALGTLAGPESALSEIQAARRVGGPGAPGLRRAATHVRLLVKSGRFTEAGRIADSVLAAHPDPVSAEARSLGGLAALTGRVRRTADLMAAAAPSMVAESGNERFRDVPMPAMRVRERYRAFAAFGVPADSLTRLPDRVADSLRVYLRGGGEARDRMLQLLLDDPSSLAYASIGPGPMHRPDASNYLLALQARLANGDTAAVRSQLGAIVASRERHRPGDISLSSVFHEAVLFLSAGDSASAVSHLHAHLFALSTLSPRLLLEPEQAAAVVRAFALRAALGGEDGADAVRALWSSADEDVFELPEIAAALTPLDAASSQGGNDERF